MSGNDLVKRLRNSKGWPTLGNAAADRIEELEGKLAKAVEALEYIESMTVHSGGEIHWVTALQWKLAFDEAKDVTRETLAELTGGKDE